MFNLYFNPAGFVLPGCDRGTHIYSPNSLNVPAGPFLIFSAVRRGGFFHTPGACKDPRGHFVPRPFKTPPACKRPPPP